MALLHDRHLGIFDDERLEFSRAAVLVGGGHGVADDADRSGVWHDPLGHPEFALRLLHRCPVSHREVLGHTAISKVYNELRRGFPLASHGIDRRRPESDGIAALEAALQRAVAADTRLSEEERDI